MPYGYHGKILRVNLSKSEIWTEEKDELFFRRYMGGGALGAYYVWQNVKPGTDAFEPENVIVFGGSIVSGFPIAGFTRHSITSVSPLTGGVADSEAGGFWARELKAAGFDAVVVQGRAPHPVYLWINNGRAELKDASHLWGKVTGEAQDLIRQENNDDRIRVLGIGPAGENMVRYACVVNELKHINGRGGHGAVMGSKNLKALAVRGNLFPEAAAPEAVKAIARSFASKFMDYPGSRGLRENGTSRLVSSQNQTFQLPTYNWKTGYFEKAEEISRAKIKETIAAGDEGCFACPVLCKKSVKSDKPYEIDPRYGGPEYESLAALGSYTGISDLYAVCKANELCNKYSLDTISAGASIAFAMECYENGILSLEDTDGIELRFGNSKALLPLVEKIAKREGIGDLLAEGVKRMAEKLGPKAQKFAVHCKGVEFPAHEPRVKKSLSLAYGLTPIGADHMSSLHDGINSPSAPALVTERLKPLGIYEPLEMDDLGPKKVKFFYQTHLIFSVYSSLDICLFCMAPARALDFNELVAAVDAITGWETSLWELVQLGERRLQMMRAFNIAAGLTKEDDMLPPRMYEPLVGGGTNGKVIDEAAYKRALATFYELAGWDEDGKPKESRLNELDLDWVCEKIR
ncbi:MAG: aldehyde ferredoxin oxidoreductase family protein [Peptococcaceae bacterium]|jgi:aldehyde:ferredoxin oxidoreductase|nr:aldehyde ferredoxin oxidoreductase family protein [Peptococcaceae bacterium]MDH7523906.1 aldehyde ferredoxin oxidoreductase family protein [Peptococcaceae bacterium]